MEGPIHEDSCQLKTVPQLRGSVTRGGSAILLQGVIVAV